MGRFSRFPAVNRTPEELGLPPEPPEPEPDPIEEYEALRSIGLSDYEASATAWPEPEPTAVVAYPSADEFSEMTTKEVIEWVGDDEARRSYAISAEESGRERKTLLRKLRGA